MVNNKRKKEKKLDGLDDQSQEIIKRSRKEDQRVSEDYESSEKKKENLKHDSASVSRRSRSVDKQRKQNKGNQEQGTAFGNKRRNSSNNATPVKGKDGSKGKMGQRKVMNRVVFALQKLAQELVIKVEKSFELLN